MCVLANLQTITSVESVDSPDQITNVDFLVDSLITTGDFFGIDIQRKHLSSL